MNNKMNNQLVIQVLFLFSFTICFSGDFGKAGSSGSGLRKHKITLGRGEPIVEAQVVTKGVETAITHLSFDGSQLNLISAGDKDRGTTFFDITDIEKIVVQSDGVVPSKDQGSALDNPNDVYTEVLISFKKGDSETARVNRNVVISGYKKGTSKTIKNWLLRDVKEIRINGISGYVGSDDLKNKKRKFSSMADVDEASFKNKRRS